MEDQIALPPAPPLGDTITDVFTSPSEVFQRLKGTAPKPTLWTVPLITSIIAVILLVVIGYMNESLKAQRMDATRITFEQRVAEGKMTQEQADKTIEGMEKGGIIILVVQIVAVAIVMSILFFLYTLLLWLPNKYILKSTIGYGKHLEMFGIVNWIGILGIIVSILLMLALNSIYAQPSLALLVYQNFDISNSSHKIMALINFFGIWQTIVIGIALQKFSAKSTGLCIAVSVIAWIIILGISYLLGLGG
jgi:hypothetical protein